METLHVDDNRPACRPTVAPAEADWQTDPRRGGPQSGRTLPPAGLAGGWRPRPPGAGGFPLLVPQPYLARIRPGDPDDPLLVQVLPRKAELAEAPRLSVPDPLGEAETAVRPGLLGKYKGRFLIVATGVRRPLPFLFSAAFSLRPKCTFA